MFKKVQNFQICFQLVAVAWEVQPSRNVIMIDLELWEEELRESSRFAAKAMKAIGNS